MCVCVCLLMLHSSNRRKGRYAAREIRWLDDVTLRSMELVHIIFVCVQARVH